MQSYLEYTNSTMKMEKVENKSLFEYTEGGLPVNLVPDTRVLNIMLPSSTTDLNRINPEIWKSSVNLTVNDQVFKANSTEDFSYTVNLSCSFDPDIEISYFFLKYLDEEIPEWVILDSGNSKIYGTPPKIYENKTYKFYLMAQWDGGLNGNAPKLITINVAKYVPKYKSYPTIIATLSSQVAIGAGAAIILGSSIMTGSPSSGLWSFLQQQQMILLLMMIDDFTPEEILYYLEGVGFVFLNKLPSFLKNSILKMYIDYFD